ncbi:MAG: NAD-dependent malic enzyme [Gammaproteobacteria bacterium]|nr:MAG: NAD-dependent malic enzyme [Gammaproteobacteria bacterium]
MKNTQTEGHDQTRNTMKVSARGTELIRNPTLNKGTGFPLGERRTFGLEGLMPVRAKDQTQQAERTYEQLCRQPDDLQKYIMLSALYNRNMHLYFRVLADHLEELMPIVYTPTVGAAVQHFSHVFQGGSNGVWITPDMKGRMTDVLRGIVGKREIRLLVVTDNESILGIGDQGAGGMAISQGKLALYTAAAGIDPVKTLPVSLDFGTDNAALLEDDQYLGWPTRRMRGVEYLALVDEFVAAVRATMPRAVVQWEDFRKDNALAILDRYVDVLPSFNDDIQGTGAVVMAGLNSALQIKGERLAQQRIVIFGAGAAGLGIYRQISAQLKDEGVADQSAVIGVLDRSGLLVDDGQAMDAYKRALAWPAARAATLGLAAPNGRGLLEVVSKFRPTVLIGVSGMARAFNEQIVRAMAAHADRPVIFPSSNPSASSEAFPADLYAWTDCRCLVATGSPFPDVECGGRNYRVGQGNNVFIFPGLGLAAIAANARKVTAGMTKVASETLAAQVTAGERAAGLLFPSVSRLRAVSFEIAVAVARQAIRDGVTDLKPADVERVVRETRWSYEYPDYLPA